MLRLVWQILFTVRQAGFTARQPRSATRQNHSTVPVFSVGGPESTKNLQKTQPAAQHQQTTERKTKIMAKSDYIDPNDDKFSAQQQLFKTNIPNYASTVGVTPAQVTAQAADANYFAYVLSSQEIMQNGAQQWTAWKDLVRDGGSPPPSGAPVLPVFPTAVGAVLLGIEARYRALVKQIKAHPNYNSSIGQALGIEGAEQTPPDLTVVQPELDATINGSTVDIGWGWGGNSAYLDMIELQVDRADGKGYVLLAYDTTPGYTDTTPFPATPAKWTYRGIYRVNDKQVGLWSKPVTVNVGA
jgi:hypothetical protein